MGPAGNTLNGRHCCSLMRILAGPRPVSGKVVRCADAPCAHDPLEGTLSSMSDHVERVSRWIRTTHRLAPAEHMLVFLAQSLGRMDADLLQERFPPLSEQASGGDHFDHLERFNDHITRSYLWVLGAYELLRTLDQRAHGARLFDNATRARIRATKDRFNRVRVPLAKLEAARGHTETDRILAWPTFDDETGVGWRLAPDFVVTRRELADAFLGLLESLPDTR
jgi:hypothetical protein